ncbi:MAG TPA: hypothetical protein VE987_00155, partial [Polyangiaceae bacterium]|nr:hypothetical protein [Polyangiaceae bacterium]
GPSTVGAGETFPILIPANVTVTTADGAVTVAVPAKTSGFTLQAPASGVVGGSGAPLTIDGQSHAATFGIVATTGATAATTIGGVTVQNFLDAGILVERTAVLTIGPGVTSTGNGTTAARSDGLHVTGNANAVIMVAANQTPTHFDGNTDHGILVDTAGFITLTGSSTAASVTTNGNFAAGVWIAQTPGAPPQNVIDGLVSRGATNGNGLRFIAGSSVKLRNTISTGNQGSGVLVSSSAASSDISKIDLGDAAGDASAADYGHNTLQAPLGSGNNGNAGICLNVRANSGVLAAAGNNFASAACATAAGTVTINKNGCGNGACTGGTCDLGIAAGNGAGNDIDVSLCTHP